MTTIKDLDFGAGKRTRDDEIGVVEKRPQTRQEPGGEMPLFRLSRPPQTLSVPHEDSVLRLCMELDYEVTLGIQYTAQWASVTVFAQGYLVWI